MKIPITIIFVLLIFNSVSGQDSISKSEVSIEYFPETSIYIELGGNGTLYSLNLEKVIFEKNNRLTSRIGISFLPVWGNELIIIPFEVAYLLGNSRDFLELGMGIDFIFESYDGGNTQYIRFVPRISYRHYNNKGNRYVRIGYTPILDKSIFGFENTGWMHIPIWFGLGFGFIIE